MFRDRDTTIDALIALLGDRGYPPLTIVETGTIRHRDYGYGLDGHSTLLWAWYVTEHGGRLFSIDNDPKAVEVCREILTEKGYDVGADSCISIIESDSVEWLRLASEKFPEPIDLLYLDSANDADLILAEAQAIEPHLGPGTIILIDDVNEDTHPEVQKGSKVLPYLKEQGWVVRESQYQALLTRTEIEINNLAW